MPTAEWSVPYFEIDDEKSVDIIVEALCQRRGRSESFRYRLYVDDQLVSEERRSECETVVKLRGRVSIPEAESLRLVAELQLESLHFQSVEEMEESLRDRFRSLYMQGEQAAGPGLRNMLFEDFRAKLLAKENHPADVIRLGNAHVFCHRLAEIAKNLYDDFYQKMQEEAEKGVVDDSFVERLRSLGELRWRWDELARDADIMVAAAESRSLRAICCGIDVAEPYFRLLREGDMNWLHEVPSAWQPF